MKPLIIVAKDHQIEKSLPVLSHSPGCRVKRNHDSANEMRSANKQDQAVWWRAHQRSINKLTEILLNKI